MTIGDAMMKLLNRTDDSPMARFYTIEWPFKTPCCHWDLLSLFATLCLATMLLEVVVLSFPQTRTALRLPPPLLSLSVHALV
jgi:hypothetical protein